MSKKAKPKKLTVQYIQPQTMEVNSIPLALQYLAKKRIGGAVNLRGIYFQLLFAIHTTLSHLKDENDSCQVWMEGVEDIDVYVKDRYQFYQIKTSQNCIDANAIWNMKVLQHFWQAYRSSPSLSFCLVHNTKLAKGKLEGFGTDNLADDTVEYWHQKFTQNKIPVTSVELKIFLGNVSFTSMNEQELYLLIHQNLINLFGINTGTESAFFQALFHWVFEASKQRKILNFKDLTQLIESVKYSFSKFPANPAIQNNWISAVSYQIPEGEHDLGYYDGKAARPVDIARQLPIHRPEWEKAILDSISKFDITIIKSSSGQGKSTLAWQLGYKLQIDNFSIYQLHYCRDYNEANAINDFIDSRIKVGQIPLIVIDGLTQHHEEWNELAKLLRDKPVKLLITTRQEDWIRYGEEAAAITLSIIEIKLTIQEAKLVYNEIAKNKKLHPSIMTWEPVWERVKDRGLMIEYIFLLTRGQMIAERLFQQISKLKSEEGSAAKLEILRLISLADILGVKVNTLRLTNHIQKHIGFVTDRNEVYRQLEKEYYLQFDTSYVEGLHPVRSDHLVKLLHSHIPVEDSLLPLLEIVDENYIYDFFISAPLIFHETQNSSFSKQAAAIMADRSIPEMVYAIDGLMHLEPYRYWQENKSIFDTVAKRGSIEIFTYDTVPFNRLQTIKNLALSLSDDENSNINFLLEKQQQLTDYSINKSLLFQFSTFLKQELENKISLPGYEGLTFLFKWFRKLDIIFPDIIKINESDLLQFLETKDIGETADIFHFYSILYPDAYRLFVDKNKNLIIGWIKKKTNTLTIYENGDDIYVNYLLDKDQDRANEFSVFRINIVHSFFPEYAHYCTQAIILPFPNADIHKAVLQNSTKRMSPDTILMGNDFDVHINQIWTKTILDKYGANSIYEWQKQYIALRKHCLELYKKCVRLIEAVLERNSKNKNVLIKEVASLATTFFEMEFSLKKYPSDSKKYFDKKLHNKELSVIDQWLSSFRNFINQLSGLLMPNSDRDRLLPLINIRAAEYRLPEMQKAHNLIADDSHKYFESDQLCIDENKWLTRLYHTVEFYIDQAKAGFVSSIVVASRSIEEWKTTDQKQKLEEFNSIIREYAKSTTYVFHLPKKIIEDESLNYVVIGIQGFDITDENQLWDLSRGLSELTKTDIHFFTIVIVDDELQATGAFRVGHHYFEKFQKLLDGLEINESNWGNPLPLIPDEIMLRTLEGITLKKPVSITANESFFQMMFNIWKLVEHRQRLSREIVPENKWLEEAEKEYGSAIRDNIQRAIQEFEKIPISRDFVEKILMNEVNPEAEEICRIMMEKAILIQTLESL